MSRRRGLAVAIRIDEHMWRVILPRERHDAIPLDERLQQAVADLFPTEAYTTDWKSEFELHRRNTSILESGRIALAGDAAHLTSPVGGQGMNLGLQDAHALKRALVTALERRDTKPLEKYASERRKVLESGAVRITDALTRILLARRGVFLVTALRIVNMAFRVRPLRRAVLRSMALLDDPSRNE